MTQMMIKSPVIDCLPVGTGPMILLINNDDQYASFDFILPLPATRNIDGAGLTYNFNVDWGDGNDDDITTSGNHTHTYASKGTFVVTIDGQCEGLRWAGGNWVIRIKEIQKWGDIGLKDLFNAFQGAGSDQTFFTLTAQDTPNLTDVLDLSFMWSSTTIASGCRCWLVDTIENFDSMFFDAQLYSEDLELWNPVAATNMTNILAGTGSGSGIFNGKIFTNTPLVSAWDSFMFDQPLFNQDVSGLNLDSLVDGDSMYRDCTLFNSVVQAIPSTTFAMRNTFRNTSFNRDISAWDPDNASLASAFQNILDGTTSWSTANYDALLIAWAALAPAAKTFGCSSNYTIATAQAARDLLTGTFGWTITDNGGI